MEQILNFSLVLLVIMFGVDCMTRAIGPRAHASYRRNVGRFFATIRRELVRFARWAWRNYRQFIVGFSVGIVSALYFTGRLP